MEIREAQPSSDTIFDIAAQDQRFVDATIPRLESMPRQAVLFAQDGTSPQEVCVAG